MIRIVQFAAAVALTLTLAACGGGSGGDDDTSHLAFPSGGVRQADGTVAYCGDFQLVDSPPLRFENNTWGIFDAKTFPQRRDKVIVGEQCILAREGAMGIEFGWRWDWPLGEEVGYQYQPKGYPEVHYGLKPFFDVPSSAPDMPIRISDIQEMTVRYAVDMTAEGIYNLAFDMLLSPDSSFEIVSCQRRGEKSSFRHDKMSHILRVKRLPSGWLPRSSLAFLLFYRRTEHTGLALAFEPVALALDVDRRRVV